MTLDDFNLSGYGPEPDRIKAFERRAANARLLAKYSAKAADSAIRESRDCRDVADAWDTVIRAEKRELLKTEQVGAVKQ
jgi:hypothetical protein